MNALTKASPGHFTRAVLAIARSSSVAEAVLRAEDDNASVEAQKWLRTKAAVAAGSLNASTWGSAIADDDGAVPGMIESLRSRSLFYAMAAPGMANVFPMRKRVVAAAAIAAPADRAEAGFIPVVAGSFAAVNLAPRMTGGLLVLSDTLVQSTDIASFNVLVRELQRAIVAAVDTAVLADEILTGVTPGAISAAAPLTGLRAMLDAVTGAGNGAGRMVWACGVTMHNYLKTASLTGTSRLFPEVDAGQLLGYPLVVSDRVAASRLILVDASAFAVNEGTIDVDQARAGSIQMVDDPSGAASEVSLFQTNSTALRIVAHYAIERARSASVAASDLGA